MRSFKNAMIEAAVRRVKFEIGRWNFRNPFPISRFTRHTSPPVTLATLRETLLPKLLSGELSVADAQRAMENS